MSIMLSESRYNNSCINKHQYVKVYEHDITTYQDNKMINIMNMVM